MFELNDIYRLGDTYLFVDAVELNLGTEYIPHFAFECRASTPDGFEYVGEVNPETGDILAQIGPEVTHVAVIGTLRHARPVPAFDDEEEQWTT